MKSFKILLLLPILFFSFCTSKDKKSKDEASAVESTGQQFTIKGKLTNDNNKKLILQELSLDGNQIILDTADVDDEGNFTFNGFVREKTFAIVNLGERKNIFFVVDTTSNFNVEINGTAPLKYTVTGNKESEELAKVANITSEYSKKMEALQIQAQSNPTMTPVEQSALQAQMQTIVEELKTKTREELTTFETILPKVFAIEFFQLEVDADTEKAILEDITNMPTNKWFTLYRPKAETRIKTTVGAIAPDFSLQTPEGEKLSLSSLRGKYVLIDFWASWCGPCRQENPNVVKVYNNFKDKGFEILGVSLDKEGGAWKQAIAADGLPWKHVSDLKYWQSEAAQLYSVQAIPQTFLLDKKGVIIAKGLRGAQLESKLAELFN